MRPDFYRIVTERERSGSKERNRKSRWHTNKYEEGMDDNLLLRDKMLRQYRLKGWDPHKGFTDRTNPCRGYLHKNIGRKWDDIFSDISKTLLIKNSEPIRHVWTSHMKGEISFHCYYIGETLYEDEYRPKQKVEGFYVDPVTKTLKFIPKQRHKYKACTPKKYSLKGYTQIFIDEDTGWDGWKQDGWYRKPDTKDIFIINNTMRAEYIKGYWYIHKYKKLSEHERIVKKIGYAGTVSYTTLPKLKLVKTVQMSTRQLNFYGLKNHNSWRIQ